MMVAVPVGAFCAALFSLADFVEALKTMAEKLSYNLLLHDIKPAAGNRL